jgi:putative alpha-1,2-mannosidase
VTITLPDNREFIVEAPGGTAKNKYIQKAWLNGKPLDIPWFTHNDLINGGTLRLEMGPYPNMSWGKGTDFNLILTSYKSNLKSVSHIHKTGFVR